MEAKDLRIGNLVYLNNELYHRKLISVPLTVTGVNWKESEHFPNSKHSISLFDIRTGKEYSQFNEFVAPITLTEEWLMKFGLTRFEGQWIKTKRCGQQVIIEQTLNGFKFEYYGSSNFAFFKYVHQFQNLYFALTGQELEIKS